MSEITTDSAPRTASVELAAGLRGALGWLSLTGGLLLVVTEVTSGDAMARYLLFGAVVTIGGALLLGWRRLRLPLRTPLLGALAATLAGTPAGLLAVDESAAGMWVYSEHRGFPFQWLHRSAEFAHPANAEQVGTALDAGSPAVRWPVLAADAFFWAYVGLVLVVAALVAHRAWRGRAGARP